MPEKDKREAIDRAIRGLVTNSFAKCIPEVTFGISKFDTGKMLGFNTMWGII